MLSLDRVGASGLVATLNALEFKVEKTAAQSKSGMVMAVLWMGAACTWYLCISYPFPVDA